MAPTGRATGRDVVYCGAALDGQIGKFGHDEALTYRHNTSRRWEKHVQCSSSFSASAVTCWLAVFRRPTWCPSGCNNILHRRILTCRRCKNMAARKARSLLCADCSIPRLSCQKRHPAVTLCCTRVGMADGRQAKRKYLESAHSLGRWRCRLSWRSRRC